MYRWREAFFALPALLLATHGTTGAPTVRDVITYLNPQRTTSTQIGLRSVSIDEFNADNAKEETFSVDRGIDVPAGDCSDREFVCFRMSNVVFAVPRGGLVQSSAYTVNGVTFRVAKCYREDSNKCIVALIESNCAWVKDPPACSPFPKGRKESPRPGPVAYYIYSSRYGVTAFGLGSEIAGSIGSAEKVASMNLLQGDRGLLVNMAHSLSEGR